VHQGRKSRKLRHPTALAVRGPGLLSTPRPFLMPLFTEVLRTVVLGSPRNNGCRKDHSIACCALGCLGTKLPACWMLAPRRRRDKGKPAVKRGRKA
jgi:hypothetical protein